MSAERPRYHYAPAANWLSDPNGLVHDGSRWHMFYQYNPQGEDWGHMSWGHAVSDDLTRWQERPVALEDDAEYMIFSGSAVVDAEGSAGFGRNALVAAYTGAAEQPVKRQVQCLAFSTDRGDTWEKFAGNPVLDRQMADFRDPNVFWHAPTARWIMAVVLSDENRALIYGSTDLRAWEELSEIPTLGAPGHLWECPLLIELPVEGVEETRWLFKVDVFKGAPGSGALYLTGQFDGTRFIPDAQGWQLADWGNEYYAAIAWHAPRDAAGRPVWIGWMGNHHVQAKLPKQGWRGAMSLPRRMALRAVAGGGLRLVQSVEPACAALFASVAPLQLGPSPRTVAMAHRLTLAGSGAATTLMLEGEAGRCITVRIEAAHISVARRDPVTPELDTTHVAPRSSAAPVELWLDAGSLEVLADDGALSLTVQHRLGGEAVVLSADRTIDAEVAVLA